MQRAWFKLVSALALVLPLGVAVAPAPAAACPESIGSLDPRGMLLSNAELQVNTGKTRVAAVDALKVFPKLRTETTNKDPLFGRAQRVVALAVVRTEGLLDAPGFQATTADERRANLEWATATLRAVAKAKGNTPALQSDLAEALSKSVETRDEAKEILEKLAQKDLVSGPRAWGVLAQLRHAAGDEAGRDAALKKHEAMARKKFVVVGPTPAEAEAFDKKRGTWST